MACSQTPFYWTSCWRAEWKGKLVTGPRPLGLLFLTDWPPPALSTASSATHLLQKMLQNSKCVNVFICDVRHQHISTHLLIFFHEMQICKWKGKFQNTSSFYSFSHVIGQALTFCNICMGSNCGQKYFELVNQTV